MREILIITRKDIDELLEKIASSKTRLIAPVRKGDKIIFDEINSAGDIVHDYIQTTLSAKESVFPRYEEILHFENINQEIIINDERNRSKQTVIFGTRPCDGKSFTIMDAVFDGDYDDSFYSDKRKNTVLISLSCSSSDEFCFCTTLKGGPGNKEGSDILLTGISDDRYLAEIITDNGGKTIEPIRDRCTTATESDIAAKSSHLAEPGTAFNLENLLANAEISFDDDIYTRQSLRCIGCGACSYVCPSCTCFDIQDETDGPRGIRLRCWDSCGFAHFTVHTSWHNPRQEQSKRWRQRIMHKFYYQPDTLDVIGCTGCGRCSRSCPADMIITNHLKSIADREFTEKKQ